MFNFQTSNMMVANQASQYPVTLQYRAEDLQPYNNNQFLCRTFHYKVEYIQAFLALPHQLKLRMYMLIQEAKLYGEMSNKEQYQTILTKIANAVRLLYGHTLIQQPQTKKKTMEDKINQLCDYQFNKLEINDHWSDGNQNAKQQKLYSNNNSNKLNIQQPDLYSNGKINHHVGNNINNVQSSKQNIVDNSNDVYSTLTNNLNKVSLPNQNKIDEDDFGEYNQDNHQKIGNNQQQNWEWTDNKTQNQSKIPTFQELYPTVKPKPIQIPKFAFTEPDNSQEPYKLSVFDIQVEDDEGTSKIAYNGPTLMFPPVSVSSPSFVLQKQQTDEFSEFNEQTPKKKEFENQQNLNFQNIYKKNLPQTGADDNTLQFQKNEVTKNIEQQQFVSVSYSPQNQNIAQNIKNDLQINQGNYELDPTNFEYKDFQIEWNLQLKTNEQPLIKQANDEYKSNELIQLDTNIISPKTIKKIQNSQCLIDIDNNIIEQQAPYKKQLEDITIQQQSKQIQLPTEVQKIYYQQKSNANDQQWGNYSQENKQSHQKSSSIEDRNNASQNNNKLHSTQAQFYSPRVRIDLQDMNITCNDNQLLINSQNYNVFYTQQARKQRVALTKDHQRKSSIDHPLLSPLLIQFPLNQIQCQLKNNSFECNCQFYQKVLKWLTLLQFTQSEIYSHIKRQLKIVQEIKQYTQMYTQAVEYDQQEKVTECIKKTKILYSQLDAKKSKQLVQQYLKKGNKSLLYQMAELLLTCGVSIQFIQKLLPIRTSPIFSSNLTALYILQISNSIQSVPQYTNKLLQYMIKQYDSYRNYQDQIKSMTYQNQDNLIKSQKYQDYVMGLFYIAIICKRMVSLMKLCSKGGGNLVKVLKACKQIYNYSQQLFSNSNKKLTILWDNNTQQTIIPLSYTNCLLECIQKNYNIQNINIQMGQIFKKDPLCRLCLGNCNLGCKQEVRIHKECWNLYTKITMQADQNNYS